MPRMPVIKRQCRGQVLPSTFRMCVASLKIRFRHGFQQRHPTRMHSGRSRERYLNWHAAIRQVRPGHFIVGFDSGPVFCECELETHVGVGMTVRNMMNQLAHRPATVAIRCVELLCVESAHCRAQTLRKKPQRFYRNVAAAGSADVGPFKRSDGISKFVHLCHGTNLTMLSFCNLVSAWGTHPATRTSRGLGVPLRGVVVV